MKTVVLKGYYGRDNFGDEIMLDLIISHFQNKYSTYNLEIMNANPKMIFEKYNIKTPDSLVTGKQGKKSLINRVYRIIKSDIYLVGGGTIITDKHSRIHLIEYLVEFFIRKILKKPSIFISVGATKFCRKGTKFICRNLLKNCDLCLVRDEESYELLKNVYYSKKILLTGDLVLLSFETSKAENIKERQTKTNIGFSLMPYYESLYKKPELDESICKRFSEVIDKLTEKGFSVSLIPIQCGENNKLDYKFSKSVQENCKFPVELIDCKDNQDKMEKIRYMDVLVTMRLHALLYAVANNIPAVAINHNEKIASCLKQYNIENQSVGLNEIEKIYNQVLLLSGAKPDFYNEIKKQQEKAKNNFRYLDLILDQVAKDDK